MKTLNENWFAFTLIAVIFGILGFLLGRTTGHHGPKGMPHMMMGHGVMDKAMFISDDGEIHDLMGDIDMDVVENIEVIKGDDGRARALKMCECDMDGMRPIPREGTEFEIECDLIVSAIGQMGDLTGFEALDNGKGFMDCDGLYKVKNHDKHFACGDIVRPHLLTTAIGQGGVAADSIDRYISGGSLDKRPKVDVHHFNLLNELTQRELLPEEYDHAPMRGTADANIAIHNYEDRSTTHIIAHEELFVGHFGFDDRTRRTEIHIDAKQVLGNFEERIRGLTEEEAQHEGSRCMSCGICFECDNCVIFCPQDAIFRVKKDQRAVGRYVDTDYNKCIGCHICKDVCPSGYIQMGLGE